MTLSASFNEFNLDLELNYAGEKFEAADVRPSAEEIIADESAVRRLAGFLVRRQVDKVTTSGSNAAWTVRLHFDH